MYILHAMSLKRLFSNWTHFVPLCHITDLFLSYWINGWKCLAANGVHKFIVDEKLLMEKEKSTIN